MFLTLAAFLCNFIHSRNWNAIADSICSKQKMFTDSVLSAGGWEDAQIFFVKSNDFRGRLMYQSNFGQTSSWEY